jgi:hypothetical protein
MPSYLYLLRDFVNTLLEIRRGVTSGNSGAGLGKSAPIFLKYVPGSWVVLIWVSLKKDYRQILS